MSQLLLAALLFCSGAFARIYYAGVAESGGEFGVHSSTKGTGLPGRFGVDYAFINESTIDIFVDQHRINTFRVAFLLERMCPISYGLGKKFNETHFQLYQEAINYITITKGANAILDPHNYMRYNDPSNQPNSGSIIGDTSDPAAASTQDFQDFWEELASRFKNNSRVMFGIMNEPHNMPTQLVLRNDQAALDGIRSSGAKNLVIAPGNGYTAGHSWLQTLQTDVSSASYIFKLYDPLRNTAIDIHEYLDSDFSGTHQACTQPGPTNLANLTTWLRRNSLKAIVTEFGGDNNTQCADYLTSLVQYLDNNREYIGWTMYSAGPLWGTSAPCCNDGAALGSLEPGSTAAGGGPSLYDTVWLPTMQPLVPTGLSFFGGMTTLLGNKGGTVKARRGDREL